MDLAVTPSVVSSGVPQRTIRLWNSLDNETVNQVTLQQFKNSLLKHVAII